MMRSEFIPPVGTEVAMRLRQDEPPVPVEVVGHLEDPVLGQVLELRSLGSRRVFQRLWPSPTIDVPPAA